MESRFPPPKRTPLKVRRSDETFATIDPARTVAEVTAARAKAGGPRVKLYVAGVAAALGLTEQQVRMRVHRAQWGLIPVPYGKDTAPGGGKWFWYADEVEKFKEQTK